MPVALEFRPRSLTATQFEEILRRMTASGHEHPAGRLHHIAFGAGDNVRVFDVWQSPEQAQAFGAVLGPVLADLGIEMDPPTVSPVHFDG